MRRWLVISGLGLVALILCGFLSVILLYPRIGAWAIRARVLPKLEERLGLPVQADAIRVERGHATIEGLEVARAQPGEGPLVRVERIEAEFDFWASLTGDIEVSHALAQGAHVTAGRRADGTDELRDLLRRVGLRRDPDDRASERPRPLGRLRPEVLDVRDASLEYVDQVAGITLAIADIDTSLPRHGAIEVLLTDVRARTSFGPRASAVQLRIETWLENPVGAARVHVVGGQLAVVPPIALSSVAGTIANADLPGSLEIALEGSYGGSDEILWQASGTVDPLARTGALHIEAERFSLGRLSSILADSMLVDFEDTSVGARMDLESRDGVLAFSGGFEVENANIHQPLLAAKTVRDIDIDGHVDGRVDMDARLVDIEGASVRMRKVEYRLSGQLAMPGGVEPETGERREHARLRADLEIPPVLCQTMLDGFPEELVPYLEEFRLMGTFAAHIRVAIDWADLDATELDGSVGIDRCRVIAEPEGETGMDRLLETFTHYVEVEREQWVGFIVGPDNPDYVPLLEVSPYVLDSFMTTEDSRFYDHDGFIAREFKSALIKNLKAGYFRYGASSITMQTVKNVILYREKTLARKLQELFFTWHIENRLEKDRILEIYVNAIEFGPDIYGIGAATRHYFGKLPRDINPVEAAFLSSILPSPKKRYEQYCQDRLWRSTNNKIERILGLMHRRGRLTDGEYELARVTPLVFDRTDALSERECKRKVREAIANARPTNPLQR